MKLPTSKTTISGWISAVLGLLAFVATVPSDLQAMLMSVVPKPVQPWLALIFAAASFFAKGYQGQASQDKLPVETQKALDDATIVVQNSTSTTSTPPAPIVRPPIP